MNTSSRTRIVTLSDGWTMRQAPGTIRWALYDQNNVFSHMLTQNLDMIVSAAFESGMAYKEAEQATGA
jgi:hypothetical protein